MRRYLWLAVCSLPVVCLGCGGCRNRPAVVNSQLAAEADDPRRTYDTPYRNVRPEVKYVGDDACARCHQRKAAAFHQHPMGRSLMPMAEFASQERLDAASHNPFESSGWQYSVRREGNRVFHEAAFKDAKGKVVAEMANEVKYVLGSGSRGRSYLVEHDGFVFQSPITWFGQKQMWNLSPGYGPAIQFDRGVDRGCLFCHCNQVDAVENTRYRYREPVFHGYAIGCERCHGPGELHVKKHQAKEKEADSADGIDYTIVNPANLSPVLREAVCQQCHLQGEAGVRRRGLEIFDFRPGLPMHRFREIYVLKPEYTDNTKAISHVQQIYASKCYAGSAGRFGCISCHEPHHYPAPVEKAAYFRRQCQQCHQQKPCAVPEADRVARNQDNCVACHMPRMEKTNVAHTALTDHRLLRDPAHQPASKPARSFAPGEVPVVNFYQDVLDLPEEESARDLGLGLVEVGRRLPPIQKDLAKIAAPLLEQSLQAWPDDLPAVDHYGTALLVQGRQKEAMELYEKTLARHPEREMTLSSAAQLAVRLHRGDQALELWRRTVAVNPWSATYRQELAAVLCERKEFAEAAKECQAALAINPSLFKARRLLVQCHLKGGDKDRARAELDILLSLAPAEEEKLRRWFETQSASQAP